LNSFVDDYTLDEYKNFVWGPSYWLESNAGNDAAELPSMVRLIGYMVGEKPTQIGYQLKKALPFIKGDNNEVECGSNFGVLIKCYYFGSEEGVVNDDVMMNYETSNWFIVDFT